MHRTNIAAGVTENALIQLRDQLGQYVYPVHRIDRKTAGCLVFALRKEGSRAMAKLFVDQSIKKRYIAVARGYTEKEGLIDHPLLSEGGVLQDAFTRYKTLAHAEIDVPLGKHNTSRYSLLELYPETGRMHQIRRHLNHIRHPIIGDRPHGCSKQNRLWKHRFDSMTMFLHARSIAFVHPITNDNVYIEAPFFTAFEKGLQIIGINL